MLLIAQRRTVAAFPRSVPSIPPTPSFMYGLESVPFQFLGRLTYTERKYAKHWTVSRFPYHFLLVGLPKEHFRLATYPNGRPFP